MARESGPAGRLLAFLDPLLRRAPLVVETDHRPAWQAHVRDDEANTRKQLPLVMHELTDGFEARRLIDEWIGFYNTERPHSALDGKTPAEAYRGDPLVGMMDKPLRALPTYPQAQQQRQEDLSKEILAV